MHSAVCAAHVFLVQQLLQAAQRVSSGSNLRGARLLQLRLTTVLTNKLVCPGYPRPFGYSIWISFFLLVYSESVLLM